MNCHANTQNKFLLVPYRVSQKPAWNLAPQSASTNAKSTPHFGQVTRYTCASVSRAMCLNFHLSQLLGQVPPMPFFCLRLSQATRYTCGGAIKIICRNRFKCHQCLTCPLLQPSANSAMCPPSSPLTTSRRPFGSLSIGEPQERGQIIVGGVEMWMYGAIRDVNGTDNYRSKSASASVFEDMV